MSLRGGGKVEEKALRGGRAQGVHHLPGPWGRRRRTESAVCEAARPEGAARGFRTPRGDSTLEGQKGVANATDQMAAQWKPVQVSAEAPCTKCQQPVKVPYLVTGKEVRDSTGAANTMAVFRCLNCRNAWAGKISIPKELLPPVLTKDETELIGDAVETELATDVFSEYRCQSIRWGVQHPSDNIIESSSMSSCELPVATYPLRDSLGGEVQAGLLSSLQLEGVLYACQKHSTFLPGTQPPARRAFFLGDAAGIGKGRQIAATILDNFSRCAQYCRDEALPLPTRDIILPGVANGANALGL